MWEPANGSTHNRLVTRQTDSRPGCDILRQVTYPLGSWLILKCKTPSWIANFLKTFGVLLEGCCDTEAGMLGGANLHLTSIPHKSFSLIQSFTVPFSFCCQVPNHSHLSLWSHVYMRDFFSYSRIVKPLLYQYNLLCGHAYSGVGVPFSTIASVSLQVIYKWGRVPTWGVILV